MENQNATRLLMVSAPRQTLVQLFYLNLDQIYYELQCHQRREDQKITVLQVKIQDN